MNVIFDMDGLMFDTERVFIMAWDYAGEKLGIGRAGYMVYKTLGMNIVSSHHVWKEEFGDKYNQEELRRYTKEFLQKYYSENTVPVKKGLHNLLDYLKENSCKMAVASSSPGWEVEKHLKEANVYGYFTGIVCGDMVQNSKPDPEIYLKACELLEANPSECYALEDSKNGLLSAYRAGCKPIMVPDLWQPDDEILNVIVGKYEDLDEVKAAFENIMSQTYRLLLFDLDGTLLQSDKTISKRALSVLKQCREKGILIGVSTSRSEQNSMTFLNELMPDILISSGGALVKNGTQYIYKAEFTEIETRNMIHMARAVCGEDCEITIDTADSHYWNYKINPKKLDQSWGDSIYTDFTDFSECALKMCVEIFDKDKADMLADRLNQCDCIRFSDGYWYKFTKNNVTKENAIIKIAEVCGFGTESIIAFGDDFADIGMLELCGLGVAMGNAIDEVKNKADIVIGSNDEEGIADFIEGNLLNEAI